MPRIQLFPALVRYPLIAAILLVATFLFGRLYCSSLCPLATVQDVFIPRKRRFSFRKLGIPLRYLLPLVSLIGLLAGFPALASFFDPYSMSGRIISSVNELAILPLVDLMGLILRRFSLYITTFPIQFRWITIGVSAVSIGLLFMLSRIGGRLYCNTLCPVGALLSIPARWSLFGFRINPSNCTSCGACERVCKAEAIDSAAKVLDTSRCVSCFNCSDVCQFDALYYGRKHRAEDISPNPVAQDTGRRDFLKKTGSATLLLVGAPVLARAGRESMDPVSSTSVAVPPGAESRGNFLSHCTSCSLCISRCLGNVLQPASLGPYGIRGLGVPFMDFNRGSCEFECKLCSELCPSGAIYPLALDVKKQVKIGEAKFVREYCVVETDATSCGACGEICPSGAIEMVHVGDSPDGALEIPLVKKEFCIGCGSCQFVCPVIEKNAIFVEALESHAVAEVREKKDDGESADVDNTFAF